MYVYSRRMCCRIKGLTTKNKQTKKTSKAVQITKTYNKDMPA